MILLLVCFFTKIILLRLKKVKLKGGHFYDMMVLINRKGVGT